MSTPRYQASDFEEEILQALDGLDPSAPEYYSRSVFTVDLREYADGFKQSISPTLISIISDKWEQGRLRYVSGWGIPAREYVQELLRERKAELEIPTRRRIAEILLDWQTARGKRLAENDEHNFSSGIDVILPVSGAVIAVDLVYADDLA